MDITSISPARYIQSAFNPVAYSQPSAGAFHGGQLGAAASGVAPSATSPLYGSLWHTDDTVWIAQTNEKAYLERAHVSEAARSMLSKMEGQWEVQSWKVGRLKDTLNSMERAAIATRFMTDSALSTLMTLKSRLDISAGRVDIYA